MNQQKTALISVSNKENITELAQYLIQNNYQILSTGGTYNKLKSELNSLHIYDISSYINHPEILNGRVKTLHPKIYGGILSQRDNEDHMQELKDHNIIPIDLIIVNLYPFKEAVDSPKNSHHDIIENIDIGGHTLIRASAKNYKDVLIITDPNDYTDVINNLHNFTEADRRKYATKAFKHIAVYDAYILNYFEQDQQHNVCPDTIVSVYEKSKQLKYGTNPQQANAGLYRNINNQLPFAILNGNPGYINLLDAIYSWSLA